MYARFITIYTNLLLSTTPKPKTTLTILGKTILQPGKVALSVWCVCVYKIFKARCVSIAKIMIETGNGAFSCTLHCDETLWMNWQVDGGMAWWWCCFALLWSTPNLYTQIKENKCNYSANSKLNNIHEHNTHIQTHRLFSRSFSLKTVREFDKERIVRTSGTNCTKCSNVKM